MRTIRIILSVIATTRRGLRRRRCAADSDHHDARRDRGVSDRRDYCGNPPANGALGAPSGALLGDGDRDRRQLHRQLVLRASRKQAAVGRVSCRRRGDHGRDDDRLYVADGAHDAKVLLGRPGSTVAFGRRADGNVIDEGLRRRANDRDDVGAGLGGRPCLIGIVVDVNNIFLRQINRSKLFARYMLRQAVTQPDIRNIIAKVEISLKGFRLRRVPNRPRILR